MECSDTPSDVLREVVVRPIERDEQTRYQAHMSSHHYLGALPRIGEEHVLRGDLVRGMGRTTQHVGGGPDVRGARSRDRLGLSLPVGSPALDCQQ